MRGNIESEKKVVRLLLPNWANGYNKDVYCCSRKKNKDKYSEGCNYLIKYNKASLITDAADIIEMMGWKPPTVRKKNTVLIY